jgi:hypothetical protein
MDKISVGKTPAYYLHDTAKNAKENAEGLDWYDTHLHSARVLK